MRGPALMVVLLFLWELPRDWQFFMGGEAQLRLGLSLKTFNGLCSAQGLWRGWRVCDAFLVCWCLQGLLMSMGEWEGLERISFSVVLSLLSRVSLLGWTVHRRILRKEGSTIATTQRIYAD